METVASGSDSRGGGFDRTALSQTLKSLRTERGLTLEDVARGTRLSISFLSMVENGKSDISIARLHRIAEFYDLHIRDLFDLPPQPARRVVPLNEAREVASSESGVHLLLLAADPGRRIEPFYLVMEPGSAMEPIVHEGEEFVHVLQGCLRVTLSGDSVHILNPGDTIYYAGSIPHVVVNAADTTTIAIGSTSYRKRALRA